MRRVTLLPLTILLLSGWISSAVVLAQTRVTPQDQVRSGTSNTPNGNYHPRTNPGAQVTPPANRGGGAQAVNQNGWPLRGIFNSGTNPQDTNNRGTGPAAARGTVPPTGSAYPRGSVPQATTGQQTARGQIANPHSNNPQSYNSRSRPNQPQLGNQPQFSRQLPLSTRPPVGRPNPPPNQREVPVGVRQENQRTHPYFSNSPVAGLAVPPRASNLQSERVSDTQSKLESGNSLDYNEKTLVQPHTVAELPERSESSKLSNQQIQTQFGFLLNSDKNALFVERIDAGGVADRAGIQRFDRVISLGGAPLKTVAEFCEIAGLLSAGDQIEIELQRDGKKISETIQLGMFPEPSEAAVVDDGNGPVAEVGLWSSTPDNRSERLEKLVEEQREVIGQLQNKIRQLEKQLAESSKATF